MLVSFPKWRLSHWSTMRCTTDGKDDIGVLKVNVKYNIFWRNSCSHQAFHAWSVTTPNDVQEEESEKEVVYIKSSEVKKVDFIVSKLPSLFLPFSLLLLDINVIWGQLHQHVYEQLLHAKIPKAQKTVKSSLSFCAFGIFDRKRWT